MSKNGQIVSKLMQVLLIAALAVLPISGCSQKKSDEGSSTGGGGGSGSGGTGGGSGGGSGSTPDTTAPTIQSISAPTDGSYLAGRNLDFTLTFSEAVTVSGSPRLTLTIGANTRYATYLSGSSSTQLIFRYSVQTADTANSVSVSSPIDLNSGSIADAAANASTLTFTAPNTANVRVVVCPTNYVLVAALSPYTTSPFCVAKYEMKNVSGAATSQASGAPWVNISRPSSITACSNLGAGYSLIANSQWQTIAQNLEKVGFNWNNATVGDLGGMSAGHSDGTPNAALAASSDDNVSCSGTGQSCNLSTWNDQRRVLKLASGSYIWDFAGNVWEWVLDDNSAMIGATSFISTITNATHPTTTTIGGVTNTAKYHFGASTDYTSHSTYPHAGFGNAWLDSNGGTIIRGGNWSNSTEYAGVFAAAIYNVPNQVDTDTGFRCVWAP